MHTTTADLLLICALAAVSLLASDALQLAPAGGSAGTSCIPRERDALLSFKRGITSDHLGVLDSWHKEDCCRWWGVKCSNRTGHVLRLHLRNLHVDEYRFNYIDGYYGDTALVGEISNSLLSMDRLVHLDLSMNYLGGPNGHMPEFLGSLTRLKYLNLSGIPFSGRVPPQLGNLSNLQHLDLSCQYYPCMYSNDISWVARIPNLQFLGMNSVNLNTIVDWPYVINMIPSLKALNLRSCFLPTTNQSLPHINLTKLERLDLSDNIFAHPMARSWFWNLTGLQHLYLAETQLYGQAPDALAHMTSLQVLDLSSNLNMGMIYTSFKNICSLRILRLYSCPIGGNINDIIGRMPQCPLNKLQELYLGSNNITGIMPDRTTHLSSLVVLDISRNNLTGGIPRGVGLLSSLSSLYLAYNSLTGPVPSEIGMLGNLTMMDLSRNNLNGDFTEEHFTSLTRLKGLYLSGSSLRITVGPNWIPPFSLEEAILGHCQLGPSFPAWLQFQVDIHKMDITRTGIADRLPDWFNTTFAKATYLDISNNEISGRLPRNMEFMSLENFFINSNKLTGEIPNLPRNITTLDLSGNSLSGKLPSNIGITYLSSLWLRSNQITGCIPKSLCKAEALTSLDLSNNLLEGQFPQCFGMKKNILFLMLSNNRFSGNFPLFLKEWRQLVSLDLSRNSFFGRLPLWIGELAELRFLGLNHNTFSGEIPPTISNLSHLRHLNLAGNGLSGAIPWHLSNITAMIGMDESNYENELYYVAYLDTFHTLDFSSAVVKGRELNYSSGIWDLVSIDLSFNQLTGVIPEEIAALDALINLNLSWNQLSGKIPNKLGALKALESLDLSRNMLSGGIPSSLSDITYLSYLDLCDNNLTGRIPSGRQFDTLYTEQPSMYSGNSGLCGPPLPNSCPGKNVTRQDDQKRNEHSFEPMTFYFGLALGFVLGLWVVFCFLLFKRAWRAAYFCMVDKTYDQMYVFAVLTWKSWARKGTTN